MVQLIKLVWRLDYNFSYKFLDSRGAALDILTNTEEDFWQTVGDGNVYESFVARNSTDTKMGYMSLEAASLNGTIEWREGIELGRALEDPSFRGTDRIVKGLLKLCEIKTMKRVGLRMYCTDTYANQKKGGVNRFAMLLDVAFRSQSRDVLGPLDDIGIVLEGLTPDKVNYRVAFGPLARKNVEGVLEQKPNEAQLKRLIDHDLFFDIDLFETNISFSEHSLFRWANTKVAKAANFITMCRGSKEA